MTAISSRQTSAAGSYITALTFSILVEMHLPYLSFIASTIHVTEHNIFNLV